MNQAEDRNEPNSMKALKVLIFTETYFPVMGGGETQAQLLAEGLIANGHSVTLLTRRSDRRLPKFERIESVPVYRLPPHGRGQLKKWGLAFSCIPALLKLRKSYDVIFVSGFRIIGMTAIIMSKLMRKKCILKADSQGEMSGGFFIDGLKKFGFTTNFLPFKLFLSVRNAVLRKADAFSAISDEIAAELSANKVSSIKIIEIPNSVDTSRFYPVSRQQKSLLRKKLAIPETATMVVYTGRLVSYKGLPLLLKVWRDVQNRHQDSKLYLLGTGGMDIHNCEDELHAYVKANGLEASVCFTGSVQNVPEYLQAADIFAFPTENDAFPSSLVEAMTCALPVITTPVGAIKSIIRSHYNGLMIQPGNEQQLYQAFELLISNQDLSGELGRAAWKTVRENYSAEIVTERYLSLFQKTIA
jgi:glycosyltransferase involved in cell wall biosynthesis